ncbi:MAG TPA: glycosyltransferase, partial [Planctomycetota bacterium]|nr:glycosyltransferase [Planctomycetota bacterium]
MIVGLDYRPALLQFAGIARYGRQLARALARELGPDDELRLFAHSWAMPSVPRELWQLDGPRVRLHRRRIPGRAVLLGHRLLGRGVDDWIGGCDVFHRTDFVRLPVRRAAIVATVFDASFAVDDAFHEPAATAQLRKIARELIEESAVVLAPSEFAGAELVVRLGAPPAKVVITPLGMDHFPGLPTTRES